MSTLTLVSPAPEEPGIEKRLADTRALLQRFGLQPGTTSPLLRKHGNTPILDGNPLYLESSYLGEGARGLYLTIWDARPGPHLAKLVWGLASVGKLLVTVTPAPPHIVACGEALDDADVVDESTPPWLETAARAHTPTDLLDILNGGWFAHRIRLAERYWGPPEDWPSSACAGPDAE